MVCLWKLYLTDCPTSVGREIRLPALPFLQGMLGLFCTFRTGVGISPRLFFALSRPCRWTVERMALSPLGKFLVLTTHSLIYKLNIASQRTVPALYVGQPPFQKQLLIYSLFRRKISTSKAILGLLCGTNAAGLFCCERF